MRWPEPAGAARCVSSQQGHWRHASKQLGAADDPTEGSMGGVRDTCRLDRLMGRGPIFREAGVNLIGGVCDVDDPRF